MSRGAGPLITDLFVYGTLKRGECRDSMWPRKPIQIRDAFILAQLYDLGPYPAIRVEEEKAGSGGVGEWGVGTDEDLDWIRGEVWSFEREDVLVTIARLDEIENTNQSESYNLYDHVLVRVHDRPRSTTSGLALAYQYSSSARLDHSRRLRPRDGEEFVSWSAARKLT